MCKKVNKKIVIALDGVSASGKGSVAKLIAKEFNLSFLETGLIYRAVGYYMLKNSINPDSTAELIKIAQSISLNEIQNLNLQCEDLAKTASIIAKNPELRKTLVFIQRNFANNIPLDKKGTILDGRDIGTVICPYADIKFFLTADIEIRAKRRLAQLGTEESKLTLEKVINNIKARDTNDEYLNLVAKNHKDYIIIDNSELNLHETFNVLKKYVQAKLDNSTYSNYR